MKDHRDLAYWYQKIQVAQEEVDLRSSDSTYVHSKTPGKPVFAHYVAEANARVSFVVSGTNNFLSPDCCGVKFLPPTST
jgi:hypothetical protein